MRPMPSPAGRPLSRSGRTLRLAGLALLGLAATACVGVPKPLQGAWPALTPQTAGTADIGAAVRWGGRIVALDAVGAGSCFRLIAQPLAANGQPDGSATSLGRFSACRSGTYDPRKFAPNREVTITGRIETFERQRFGGDETLLPRVAAEAVVLWPQRR